MATLMHSTLCAAVKEGQKISRLVIDFIQQIADGLRVLSGQLSLFSKMRHERRNPSREPTIQERCRLFCQPLISLQERSVANPAAFTFCNQGPFPNEAMNQCPDCRLLPPILDSDGFHKLIRGLRGSGPEHAYHFGFGGGDFHMITFVIRV